MLSYSVWFLHTSINCIMHFPPFDKSEVKKKIQHKWRTLIDRYMQQSNLFNFSLRNMQNCTLDILELWYRLSFTSCLLGNIHTFVLNQYMSADYLSMFFISSSINPLFFNIVNCWGEKDNFPNPISPFSILSSNFLLISWLSELLRDSLTFT